MQLNNHHSNLYKESIYSTYSSPLYGVILKFIDCNKEADEVLLKTFNTFYSNYNEKLRNESIFIAILKIAIEGIAEKKQLTKRQTTEIMVKELIMPYRNSLK